MRWKIDFIVLPIFLVTQALQFMDRTALNYANLFNYQKALGLKGQQFNYLSASKCPQVAQARTQLTRSSDLCRILLRPISMRLAHRSLPCTESCWRQLSSMGGNGSRPDRLPNIPKCSRSPIHHGHIRGSCNPWPYFDDWILVHEARDPTPSMHLVFISWLGRHRWFIYLNGCLEASGELETGTLGIDILYCKTVSTRFISTLT